MSSNNLTEGDLIKQARKSKGLTQKQLAEKTGLAAVTIQQYERNLREPRLENVKKIALALNIPTDSLLGSIRIGVMSEFDREKMEYFNPGSISDSYIAKMNVLFKQLNIHGQEKAIEQLELLIKVPEYTQKIETREAELNRLSSPTSNE